MKWINLIIVFALIFGGALALSLEHIFWAVALMTFGTYLGIVLANNKQLPQ